MISYKGIKELKIFLIIIGIFCSSQTIFSQEESIVEVWNEMLLEAIRNDLARPTVHARNLFHTSIGMYDSWTIVNGNDNTFLLGKTLGDYESPFEGIEYEMEEREAIFREVVSYASYRIIRYRFRFSPGVANIFQMINRKMTDLGYNTSYTSTEYTNGIPAALGNYIADQVISFGGTDGSNERNNYANQFYAQVNRSLAPALRGNPNLEDFDRWQPLSLEIFVDQAGNEIPGRTPAFLSPEWGQVVPFALTEDVMTSNERGGFDYKVYHDPGSPPSFLETSEDGINNYQWHFTMPILWSSHLDPSDQVMIDISPRGLGKLENLPTDFGSFDEVYNYFEGSDNSTGREFNPITGQPYSTNVVLRGDYARVLAEYWADGPDSETPPGHWFTILNKVLKHEDFEFRYKGIGNEMEQDEYRVKAYLTLGGAVHDAAIAAWGAKGYYDYLRPISAIRGMAELGQASDASLPNYHPKGLPLYDGFIELINEEDSLAINDSTLINEIKIRAWKGPDFIQDEEVDVAGVDWIPALEWWPYQRPTFITPPFAGYVSGHSTFSRAAAEVLTAFTGSEFFPGGLADFVAKKNEFLVFEEGPSEDVVLQWATYQDASDQSGLSRIWGGIHPPADDIPGRIMGEKIGLAAFAMADSLFALGNFSTDVKNIELGKEATMYPNPIAVGESISIDFEELLQKVELYIVSSDGAVVLRKTYDNISTISLPLRNMYSGIYYINIKSSSINGWKKIVVQDK